MIKVFYQKDIIERLGAIITYGINEGYSYKAIEEHFISSPFVNELENNEYDIESKIEDIVEDTFKVNLNKPAEISFKGLFFAESYFRLFISYNRSFEYLFLYWPISMFVEKYDIYHEMDFSSLRSDLNNEITRTTLLRKLSSDKQIKLSEISRLTGINENTIDKYSRLDKYLAGASAEVIYKLAKLFRVKENLFITNLGIYLDQSIYLYDKSNQDYRNYLGFYFANFFDNRINEKDYEYDSLTKLFISKNSNIKIAVIASENSSLKLNVINNNYDESTYLIIFLGALYIDKSNFNYLKDSKCLDIMVITQEFVYVIKKSVKKEITDIVYRSLITRAKEKADNKNS